MIRDHEVGIIGAGPAGISAAVQLCRCGFSVILFEKGRPGGLIRNAWRVENLAVLPMSPGPQVADMLEQRVRSCGARLITAEVETARFDLETDRFIIHAGGERYFVHTLVLASGTKPRPWPQLTDLEPTLAPYVHRHVADLDGAGRCWAVIGGGDAAFDYSLTLADGQGQVFLLHRGERVSALRLLQKEVARRSAAITLWTNTELLGIKAGDRKALALVLSHRGTERQIEVDGLLPAIGRLPADDCLTDELRSRLPDLQKQQRFFAIGDVQGGHRRQVGIALGQGLDAAMAIEEAHAGAHEGET
jgi:thioredoxin reductase